MAATVMGRTLWRSDTGTAALEIGRLLDAWFDADGSVWILDGVGPSVVHVSASGDLVARFGTEGAGPGEFSRALAAVLPMDSILVVADLGNERLTSFTKDGTYLRSVPLDVPVGVTQTWAASPQRLFRLLNPSSALRLAPAALTTRLSGVTVPTLQAVDPATGESTVVAEIAGATASAPGAGSRSLDFPLLRVTAGERQRLVLGMTSAYDFAVLDLDGGRRGSIRRDVERRPMSADMKAALETRMDAVLEQADDNVRGALAGLMQAPSSLPVVMDILGGPRGDIWLQRGHGLVDEQSPELTAQALETNLSTWDAFDSTLRYLGVREVSIPGQPLDSARGRLLMSESGPYGESVLAVVEVVAT